MQPRVAWVFSIALAMVLTTAGIVGVLWYTAHHFDPPAVIEVEKPDTFAADRPWLFLVQFDGPVSPLLDVDEVSSSPEIPLQWQWSQDRTALMVEALVRPRGGVEYRFEVGPFNIKDSFWAAAISLIRRDITTLGDTTTLVGPGPVVSWTFSRPREDIIIAAGGDVLFDHLPRANLEQYGPDYILSSVLDHLRSADVAFANLECPVGTAGEPIDGKNFTFQGHPDGVEALRRGSIDIVSLANNHTFDYGMEGFLETLQLLRGVGIKYTGAGMNAQEALSPVVFDIKGKQVGFLAFNNGDVLPVTQWHHDLWRAGPDKPGVVFHEDREQLFAAVKAARAQVDILIVSMHWGYEYTTGPRDYQRELGRSIIDAGADAIIGHHPHVPFGLEFHRGRPIIYSVGNLVWHPWDPEAFEGFIAILTLPEELGINTGEPGGSGVPPIGVKIVPIRNADGRAVALTGEGADAVIGLVEERSRLLDPDLEFQRDGDTLLVLPSR